MGVYSRFEQLIFAAKLNRWLKTLSVVDGLNTLKVKVSADKQQTWRKPPKGRVLVVAPHPDDEAIGCGGAIALHRRQSDPVSVVWLYDLTPARRAEAEDAAKILRINGFFGRQHLQRLVPKADLLYLPGLVENNLDHLRVHELVAREIQNSKFQILIKSKSSNDRNSKEFRVSDLGFRVLLYEVWGPLLPNRLLTIDPVIGLKEKAIRAYHSQLQDRDYLAAGISLNRYRGTSLAAGKFAEAFLELTPGEYLKWVEILR